MVKKDRTFTIKSSCVNVSGGRYKSSSPAGAAKKAANRLYQKSKNMQKFKNIKRITFVIRETTSGSDKAEYNYKASRTKLKKPLVRMINGTEVINRFKVAVIAMKTGKEVAKKSKSIKCNKKDSSFFGGNETGDGGETAETGEGGVSEVNMETNADKPKNNDSIDGQPEQTPETEQGPEQGGGRKKRTYRKKK